MKYLTQIYNLYNKLKPQATTTTVVGTKSANNTKLDYNKVRDLLIAEYSRKLLENLKQELESLYLKEREIEKSLNPHTAKHQEVVQNMHNINANLNIIKTELNNHMSQGELLINNIKEDLKLLPYKNKE